jgi:hypothetical protein
MKTRECLTLGDLFVGEQSQDTGKVRIPTVVRSGDWYDQVIRLRNSLVQIAKQLLRSCFYNTLFFITLISYKPSYNYATASIILFLLVNYIFNYLIISLII